jgi:hypothetical protein
MASKNCQSHGMVGRAVVLQKIAKCSFSKFRGQIWGADYSVKISYALFLCSCGLDKLFHEGRTCSFAELHFRAFKCQVKIFIKGQDIFNFVILLATVSRKLRSTCKI